jgi:hypothetical protein
VDIPDERLVLRRPTGLRRLAAPVRTLLARGWHGITRLADAIWSDDPFSVFKVLRALAITLLLGFCGALLAFAGALALFGVFLVGVLIHVGTLLVAWWLVRAAVKRASTPPLQVVLDRDLDLLDCDRARGRIRLRAAVGDLTIPTDAVRSVRLMSEPASSGIRGLCLSIDADGFDAPLVTRFTVDGVDFELEVDDLTCRIGRAIGLDTMEPLTDPLFGLELWRARGPARPGVEAHPFRAPAVHRRAIPEVEGPADYDPQLPSKGFEEPVRALSPLSAGSVDDEACRLDHWEPGAAVHLALHPAKPSARHALRGLVAGLATAVGLTATVGALGAMLHLADTGLGDHTRTFAIVTAVSGLLGWISSLHLAWRPRGGMKARLHWPSRLLTLETDGATEHLPFASFEGLLLRVGPRWTLELYCKQRRPVLLWHGTADPDDPDAPPLRLLIELARALDLPWRCEGWYGDTTS